MALLARHVRERLRDKIDPDLQKVLEALAEDNRVLKQGLMSVADTVDKLLDRYLELARVAGMLKDEIKKTNVKRILDADGPDDGQPTH